jgi:hypothetical protein
MSEIKFPFGPAQVIAIPDAAASTIDIVNTKTILKATAGFAQAVTLQLRASDDLMIGSEVIIDVKQNATGRNVTLSDSSSTIEGPNLTGVASDRDVLCLVWDGTSFVAQTASWNKIFDAA